MRAHDYNLRQLTEQDLHTILEWRNSERIRVNMYTDHIISWEEHRKWFEQVRKEQPARFMLFTKNDMPLGIVNFKMDSSNGTATWGFYIGIEDAPRGTGSIMACLALEYAFSVLKVQDLLGEVFSFNTASIAYHRKIGFAEANVHKVVKNGVSNDVITFSLSRESWLKNKEALEFKCLGQGGCS